MNYLNFDIMKRLFRFLKGLFIKGGNKREDVSKLVNYRPPPNSEYQKRMRDLLILPDWSEVKFDTDGDLSNYPLARLSDSAKRQIIDIIKKDIEETANKTATALEDLVNRESPWSPKIEPTRL
jgi:hypothetical protein